MKQWGQGMSGTKAVEGCNTFDVSVGMNNKMEPTA
eukprot:COSAG02_NODE_5128_length_4607_cov_32.448364_2_plen_35_part_00